MKQILSKKSLWLLQKFFWIIIAPLLVGVFAFFIGTLCSFLLSQMGFVSHIDALETKRIIQAIHPSLFLIIGCFVAPIFEEYIFRFPLTKFTYKQLLYSFSAYFILKSFSNREFLLHPSWKNFDLAFLAIGLTIIIVVYFSKVNILEKAIPCKFKTPYLVISVLFFGFLHTYKLITFQQILSVQLLFLTTLTLPYIGLGIYFSFLTQRFNYNHAVWAHILNNLRTFLILYFITKT
ncbi:hypothetical protein [Flavobacterium sp.]|uniref:hypothetical protein n=1 Tax=Flavobacterium sp. TaxID=239 RepID=UPI003D1180D2